MRTSSRQCDHEEDYSATKAEVKTESSDLYDEDDDAKESDGDFNQPDYDMQQNEDEEDDEGVEPGPNEPTDDPNLDAHDISEHEHTSDGGNHDDEGCESKPRDYLESKSSSEDPGDSGHQYSNSQSPDLNHHSD